MSTFLSTIMALIMSIMYFFGSFLGTNDPVTINVSDAEGNPVSNAEVYYVEYPESQEIVSFTPIGTTDENGDVQWADQQYGEQTISIGGPGDDFQMVTVTVSRTSNETIYIVLD
ncbi:MAG: YbfJ family protein [Clostridiales bacterium]|nr:YbfJ family protein [Clostridiales bacterium]MCD7828593.1 YbfJ family protein [Clostridiales bacterium]